MGVVFKARQKGLDRIVALKMILAGGLASASELMRFRTEAQAAARLHHPNIVQVHEVGEHEGCPYFSLEYLDGGSLAEQIAQAPLSPRLAAQVVEALAEAMDCAHRAGIIHRDLKPANVLLAADGTPKITDFGLAKRLEPDMGHTRTGAVLGTPSYMAPEQAEGMTHTIGPAADIYSLGAVLYDLITGRPPFRGNSVLETLEQVRTIEPVPPSRLQTGLPRDLETICLKCLQKDPHKRYATAGDMAADLGRFLVGKPIQARPIPTWERAWKWARRRPATAALIAVSVLAMMGFGVGGTAWAIEANALRADADRERDFAWEQEKKADARREEAERERRRAEENEQLAKEKQAEAERERKRADTNFSAARAAVDEMLTRISQERLANEPRMDVVRRDLLEKALRFHQRFLQVHSENANVRWEAGQAYSRVADIQEQVGRPRKAEEAYGQAVALLEKLSADYPGRPEFRRDLAAAHANRGLVLQAAGRSDQAETVYQEAEKLLQELIVEFPKEPQYKWDLAEGVNRRGLQAKARHALAEATGFFNRAVVLFGELARDFPKVSDYRKDLASARVNLAAVLQALNRVPEAEAEYGRALPALRQLVAEHGEFREYRQELGRALLDYATLLHFAGRLDPAEECYREAVERFTALADEFPMVPDYRSFLGTCANNYGDLLRARGKIADAERLLLQAVDRFGQLARDYPAVPAYRHEQARSLLNLGVLYCDASKGPEASKVLTTAIEICRPLADTHASEPEYRQLQANLLGQLAIASVSEQQHKKAVDYFRQAIEMLEKLIEKHPMLPGGVQDLMRHHDNLAKLLDVLGNQPEANKQRQRIQELRKQMEKQP
jgi:tetratricopeptide (TPR) repeat protein